MLILTRKIGETVNIGDDIEVSVIGVKGNQVRLGIHAPSHVAVNRQEIHERKKQNPQSTEPSAKTDD